ncbi:MAG TPA: uracil-DNA glycosylase [Balneolaceae bacterium]|nr:uracil-DNA glycosylase [Balneolaceae bacterium]
MSNSDQISVDDIIDYLKTEQEIYGPFSISDRKLNLSDQTDELNESGSTTQEISKPLSPAEKLAACSTLDELKELCNSADELRTDLENTNLVFGVGNQNADLMLIGEAPGEQEDQQGEPFVGAAGQLLNKILSAINFKREDVYIANILKHRPPGNRNPNPEEVARSLPYLKKQIELINPKILLCLGKVSGQTMLNRDDTLKNMRGAFHDFGDRLLYVTYHPAALLRNQQWKRPTWEDVQKVRKRYDEISGKS